MWQVVGRDNVESRRSRVGHLDVVRGSGARLQGLNRIESRQLRGSGARLVRLLHGLGYRDSRAKHASFPGGQEGLEIMELHGRTTALFIGLGPQSPTLGNAPGKCGAP